MGSNSSFLFVMIIMIVIWYFLLIRPQQQRVKRHKEMVNNLRKGDRVITQGGIYGKVSSVSGDDVDVEIEIASGVKIKLVKSTIQTVLDQSAPAKSTDKTAANKTTAKAPAKNTAKKAAADKTNKTTKK